MKSHTSIRNFVDQMHDMIESLRKMRLHHEEGQKREVELWSKLVQPQMVEEKAQGSSLKTHDLLEKCELKNKNLQVRLAGYEVEIKRLR